MTEPSSPPLPLHVYVHFPFCRTKCPYCDFASYPSEPGEIAHARYTDAVLAELELRRPSVGSRLLKSVFIGGGTPSLWNARELGRMLEGVLRAFPHGSDLEVTAECNPGSLDERQARAFADTPLNRLSIGVQSLDPARLAFLGRQHSPSDAFDALRAARQAGFSNLNADVILGASAGNTSPAEESAQVARLIQEGLTHISAYILTIEPGTAFGAAHRKGELRLLSDDHLARSYDAVAKQIVSLGFEHYEISNYARPGHRCRHNLGVWSGDDYLGLGCAAVGTVSGARWRNVPNPDRYMSLALGGDIPSEHGEDLDPSTRLRERIMLGLRLSDGVDIDSCAVALGVDPWPRDRSKARDEALLRGWIEWQGTKLRIPEAMWLMGDGIISRLL